MLLFFLLRVPFLRPSPICSSVPTALGYGTASSRLALRQDIFGIVARTRAFVCVRGVPAAFHAIDCFAAARHGFELHCTASQLTRVEVVAAPLSGLGSLQAQLLLRRTGRRDLV
jgi:hypothetical protein